MNRVQLIGNLGKDARVNTLPSGTTVASFSVATEDRWLDRKTNEWKGVTTWHDVDVWEPKPHIAALTKGQRVYVDGSISVREGKDKDGNKRMFHGVKAQSVELLFVPERQSDRQDAPPPSGNSRMGGTPQGAQRGAQGPVTASTFDDSDCPFAFIILAPIAGYLAQFVGV